MRGFQKSASTAPRSPSCLLVPRFAMPLVFCVETSNCHADDYPKCYSFRLTLAMTPTLCVFSRRKATMRYEGGISNTLLPWQELSLTLQLTYLQGQAMQQKHNLAAFVECSAKSQFNIKTVFDTAILSAFTVPDHIKKKKCTILWSFLSCLLFVHFQLLCWRPLSPSRISYLNTSLNKFFWKKSSEINDHCNIKNNVSSTPWRSQIIHYSTKDFLSSRKQGRRSGPFGQVQGHNAGHYWDDGCLLQASGGSISNITTREDTKVVKCRKQNTKQMYQR